MASSNIDLFVDETYLLALLNEESIPISDEKYANELSLQEVLFWSSSISSPLTHEQNPPKIFDFPTSEEKTQRRTLENGESSKTKAIFCEICMEMKKSHETFVGLSKCNNHSFCNDCVTKYLTSKIKENISSVECPYPKCSNLIDPQNCVNILPKELFIRWENALCEALILGSEKYYCPYKDCSALTVYDTAELVVEQSECPSCRRLFCARCRVKWHVGVTCDEFEKLKDDEREYDDLVVMKMAKDNKWRRCGSCSFFVEKSDGCLHMTCRCKYEFCYQCGKQWSSIHSC
ncbi:hypothetical protein RND81_05G241600 [Saponaria officinalis]|uniref:RBR-type E3 ubiquitin transferase n=1 Tax=Saponaria officinalis TaxID=3572 RepID=A0AAW1L1V6_SAPOF